MASPTFGRERGGTDREPSVAAARAGPVWEKWADVDVRTRHGYAGPVAVPVGLGVVGSADGGWGRRGHRAGRRDGCPAAGGAAHHDGRHPCADRADRPTRLVGGGRRCGRCPRRNRGRRNRWRRDDEDLRQEVARAAQVGQRVGQGLRTGRGCRRIGSADVGEAVRHAEPAPESSTAVSARNASRRPGSSRRCEAMTRARSNRASSAPQRLERRPARSVWSTGGSSVASHRASMAAERSARSPIRPNRICNAPPRLESSPARSGGSAGARCTPSWAISTAGGSLGLGHTPDLHLDLHHARCRRQAFGRRRLNSDLWRRVNRTLLMIGRC